MTPSVIVATAALLAMAGLGDATPTKCPFSGKSDLPVSAEHQKVPVRADLEAAPLPAAILTRPPNRRVDEPRAPAPEPPRRSAPGSMIFPSDRLEDSPEGQSQCYGRISSLYNGCGITKTCFGHPAGCEDSGTCQALTTVRVVNQIFTFQLMAKNAKYVAVALAPSEKMYASSSMECQLLPNGQVELYMSWNDADSKSNSRIDDKSSLTLLANSKIEDAICCEFTRVNRTKIHNRYEFYLDEQPYNLLLAAGSQATEAGVGKHDILWTGTSESRQLWSPGKVGASSNWPLKLHGALMILAWLYCVPLGSLTARYFRQAWGKGMLCGAARWFSYHRLLMLSAISLSGAAGVATLVYLKGWSESVGLHGILGAVTVALAVLQAMGSVLRPAPNHPKRPIFNWLHHSTGYASQLLAVVVIYLSVPLPASMLPSYTYYIISIWAVFYICMHALHTLSEVRPFYFLILVFGLALVSTALLVIVVIGPGN